MKKTSSPKARAEFAPGGRRWKGISRLRLATLAFGLALLAMTSPASAAPIGADKVRKAVETWVRHVTADARTNATVERIEPYQKDGVTAAYIVHLTNGGFCLCGADSLTLPVYLYCPQAIFDPKNPNCQWILKDIAGRQRFFQIAEARRGALWRANQAELSRRARAWDDLAAGTTSSSAGAKPRGGTAGPASMVLPVKSVWAQCAPWNDYCPALPAGSANHTVVGCVAMATAQLMYYWKWPNSGTGTGTNTYNYTGGNTATPLSFDPTLDDLGLAAGLTFGNVFGNYGDNGVLQYQAPNLVMDGWWDDSTISAARQITNSTWASSDAVGYEQAISALLNQLPTHKEINTADYTTALDWDAMQDSYDPTNSKNNLIIPSSAIPANNAQQQAAYLSFELGVAVSMGFGVQGSGSSDDNIPPALTNSFHYDPSAINISPMDANRMVADLQWFRPCAMGGTDPSSGDGHAWVVYGYNTGTSPTQFAMKFGWPQVWANNWYSLDNCQGFTTNQDCLVGVAPLKVVGFVGNSGSGSGSPDSPYQNIQQALGKIPNGGTLVFQANSVNTFSGTSLTINQPVTLKGYNATITK